MKKFTHIESLAKVVRTMSLRNKEAKCPEWLKIFTPVTFRGTVKIHGTNAGVALTPEAVIPQSRRKVVTPEDDSHGWARFVSGEAQTAALREIEQRIRQASELADTDKLTLFGEWCGPGILKGCGVHKLPNRQYVLFAAVVNEGDDARYLDAVPKLGDEFAEANIYSIMDAPTWEMTIDFSDRASLQAAADKATRYTAEVEKQCPWAARFGAEGTGEGIVWIPVGSHWGRTDLYFKTKGIKHKVTKPKRERVAIDPEKLASVEAFVDFSVTENRLQQAVAYLCEQGSVLGLKSTGPFLKWMAGDIQRECAAELEANDLSWKEVVKGINNRSRNWFMQYLLRVPQSGPSAGGKEYEVCESIDGKAWVILDGVGEPIRMVGKHPPVADE